jgi:DNA replication protein DnaC
MKGCKNCNYQGFVQVNDHESESCDCIKRNDFKLKIIEAKIPKKLIKLTLEDWNLKQNPNGDDLSPNQIKNKEKAYYLLRSLCDDKSFPRSAISIDGEHTSSVIFSGPKGSGKTLCLSVLAKRALKHGGTVRFYDWYDLTATLDRYDNRNELDSVVYDFENCDLIAIDNVDKIEIGNHAKNQLTRLFRKRTNNEMWTVISATESIVANMPFQGWSDFRDDSYIIKLL